MARVLKGSHSFTCIPRVHPYTNNRVPMAGEGGNSGYRSNSRCALLQLLLLRAVSGAECVCKQARTQLVAQQGRCAPRVLLSSVERRSSFAWTRPAVPVRVASCSQVHRDLYSSVIWNRWLLLTYSPLKLRCMFIVPLTARWIDVGLIRSAGNDQAVRRMTDKWQMCLSHPEVYFSILF